MPENNQRISGETPFKPEYDEFINEYRGRGSLKIQTSVAREAFPIKDAFVDVALIYTLLGFTATTLLTRLFAADRGKGEKK